MRSKGALHSGIYFHAALSAIRQCEGFIGRWVGGLVYDDDDDGDRDDDDDDDDDDERMMMVIEMMMMMMLMMKG